MNTLPLDVHFIIFRDLDIYDVVHLYSTCKKLQLEFKFSGQVIGRFIVEVSHYRQL
jgi:hypothetical protein